MCRKLHSELPEGVVEAGLHRSDRDLDDLGDLGEVEAVQVVQDDDDLVLRPERVHALEDDPPALAALGRFARGLAFGREILRAVLQGAEGDAFPRPAVVRGVARDAIEPRPQGVAGLEALDRAARAGERVEHYLFRGPRTLRDRAAEAV